MRRERPKSSEKLVISIIMVSSAVPLHTQKYTSQEIKREIDESGYYYFIIILSRFYITCMYNKVTADK